MSEIARVEVCETFVAASAARRVGIARAGRLGLTCATERLAWTPC